MNLFIFSLSLSSSPTGFHRFRKMFMTTLVFSFLLHATQFLVDLLPLLSRHVITFCFALSEKEILGFAFEIRREKQGVGVDD